MRSFGKTIFRSPEECAAYLSSKRRNVVPSLTTGLTAAAHMVENDSKAKIGNDGGWPPLAASTLSDKEKKGFAVPAPLLRTGAMRDSISSEIEGLEAQVGSDSMVAVWQELGTSKGIPPRSFLESTAVQDEEKVVEMIAEALLAGIL